MEFTHTVLLLFAAAAALLGATMNFSQLKMDPGNIELQ